MNQKYSVISRIVNTWFGPRGVEFIYKGRVNINANVDSPVMADVNTSSKCSFLESIAEARIFELDRNKNLTQIKTTFIEQVNPRSRFSNWLSRIYENIMVYMGGN